ncbi:MAG TPA: cation:proton antiporter [Candidatus Nanopelagicaceae bacterium]
MNSGAVVPISSIVETAPLILDIGIVLGLAGLLGLFSRKLGLPAILGYLLTGIIVSPFTPGYVSSFNQLTLLADIGVVLLLFEVGIELDLSRLSRERRGLLWSVPLQVLIGVLVTVPILIFLGLATFGAVLIALSLTMSSSVVIVNITRSRRRTTDVETEESLLGWSLIQDLTGVMAASIAIAVLSKTQKSALISFGGLLLFLAISIVSARLIPLWLRAVRWEGDLFLLFSVSIGLSLAAIGTVYFDIPMALAAFVAGLAINQSHDTDEVRRVLLPFRDLFAVLFFVVIGSLIQPKFLREALPFALLLLLLLILTKTIPVYLLSRISKITARPGQLAIGLSQVGEFSFVLGSLAFSHGVITQIQFTGLLMSVVASIAISTLLVRFIHRNEVPEES